MGPGDGAHRAGPEMYRGCADSGGCHRCRLDGSGTASAGGSGKSGAAGFADPTCPAARPTVGRARNGPPAAIGAGCRGAQSAGARHQRRGRRGHRLSAAGDRAACRRPGRARGAAAADRRGAPGDRAALPRRRLCAHHRRGEPRQQWQAAPCRHRGPHRQRQARRRHRPGRRPGAALPQPAHREAADRYRHAGALPAAGTGRAGCQPARRAGAVHRHTRRPEPGRPGQPAEYFRPRIHRQPRLQRDRAGRVPRPARLQQFQPVR